MTDDRFRPRCRCGNWIPVRLGREVVARLYAMAPGLVVFTYKCRRCGVVEVVVRDVVQPTDRAA